MVSPIQLSHYRGVHYRAEKIIVTNKSGKNQFSEVDRHNDEQPKTQRTVVVEWHEVTIFILTNPPTRRYNLDVKGATGKRLAQLLVRK